MEFIANALNGNFLSNVLPAPSDEVDGVLAAIAYGSNFNDEKGDFIGHCIANRYRLDIWMRYDHTVPVALPLLWRLLRHHKDNIFCNLVPDVLHSKVIWWRGYGAYIGSANLSDRAWVSNIEAGVFLTEADLQDNGMHIELENFFESLRSFEQVFPLDEDVIKELAKIEAARKGLQNIGKELRKKPSWEGPAFSEKKKAWDRRKEKFRREWHDALAHLQSIGEQLRTHRPRWVEEDVPLTWQVDQYLHAYYYNHVGEANRKPFEDYFAKNRRNPNAAVSAMLTWWAGTDTPPSNEDYTFYDGAPYIREHLSRDNVLNLTQAEFAGVCERTHATRDHVIKMKLAALGRPDLKTLSREERLPLYAGWLLQQRNAMGWSVLQLLNYVLYGGRNEDLWERLYIASHDKNYSLPHYGLNSMAELVGWALPEVTPPRNGRTSKALRALGFDVKVY
ncbi:phospholipase D-like domain-containing protein [Sideroxydans lithotrophicus]|uniref:PLD phosphodiesterase domain-containing protein n=1 Tax=Sideroxydans lithotrophicus (strain ES-1) TaxID=580332 RepID=D5CMI7_SIDLE|nr:phospholipase D-like domain-containing protein [Sideroxydans lithotrophicus]ADE12659.1 conserved hypothetical protein [Sideroxydans lithotrophicus ES-1]